MRQSPIRSLLLERGARFYERNGLEMVKHYSTFEEEYAAVRDGVGLTDFSFTNRYMVNEDGLDLFDQYVAGSVANIRFGRILHTMALNEDGELTAELYIANDDEQILLVGESLVGDDDVADAIGNDDDAGLRNISEDTVLLGLDGFNAWAVVKALFGPDVLGLPYMSIETYDLENMSVKVLRAGKTSEFGYMLLTDAQHGDALYKAVEAAGDAFGLKPVGFDTHMALRLDGRFFNIHEEGAAVKDPLSLGLQWMVDLEGDDFRGKAALFARREKGLSKKIIGLVTESLESPLATGDIVKYGESEVAKVVTAQPSPTLRARIGLALFDLEYAYAGLEFTTGDGTKVTTVSMPPFTAKSLTIRLDEM